MLLAVLEVLESELERVESPNIEASKGSSQGQYDE